MKMQIMRLQIRISTRTVKRMFSRVRYISSLSSRLGRNKNQVKGGEMRTGGIREGMKRRVERFK